MKTRTLLVALVALGLPSVVSAQQGQDLDQPGQPGTIQRDTDRQAEQPATPPTGERRESGFRGTELGTPGERGQEHAQQGSNRELINYLAARLKLANDCEIEISQLAAEQAQDQQVKQFAQKVIQDHQRLNQQLEQAVPGLASVQGIQSSQSSDRQTGEAGQTGQRPQFGQPSQRERLEQPGQPGQLGQRDDAQRTQRDPQSRIQLAQQDDQYLDGAAKKLLHIERAAAESNKQMITELLQEKQGQEFDMCYVGQQVGMHMWMVAELKAIQEHGPEELAEVAGQAESTAEEHLEKAKQLASNLMSDKSGQDSGQTGRSDRSGQTRQPGQTERSGQSGQPGTQSTERPFQQN